MYIYNYVAYVSNYWKRRQRTGIEDALAHWSTGWCQSRVWFSLITDICIAYAIHIQNIVVMVWAFVILSFVGPRDKKNLVPSELFGVTCLFTSLFKMLHNVGSLCVWNVYFGEVITLFIFRYNSYFQKCITYFAKNCEIKF